MAIEAVSFEKVVGEEVSIWEMIVALAIVARKVGKSWKSREGKSVRVQRSGCDVVNYSLLISTDSHDLANFQENRDN
jgi:hypothetical protein